MPPQLREIGFHVENHATQWHRFQHEIKNCEIVVVWIQLIQIFNMAKSSIATLKITIYNVQISLQLYSKTKKTLQYLESESCNIEK